jgi:predicted  nucleic acid-binding Zn-ribbon protein
MTAESYSDVIETIRELQSTIADIDRKLASSRADCQRLANKNAELETAQRLADAEIVRLRQCIVDREAAETP